MDSYFFTKQSYAKECQQGHPDQYSTAARTDGMRVRVKVGPTGRLLQREGWLDRDYYALQIKMRLGVGLGNCTCA